MVLFFLIFVFGGFYASAVLGAINCLTLTTSSSESDKNYCKKELAQIEAELAKLLVQQQEQRKQTGTITGDVNYLTSQINALKAKIKARGLVIAQLKISIKEKVSKIESLSEKIAKQHESIAQLIRNTNDFDNKNLVYLVLSDESLSGFYTDLESYASIKQAVKESVDQIRGIQTETEVEKQELEKKQNAETDARAELEYAQKKVTQSEAEKKQLLAISKNKEAAYQKLAAEKKAQADRIRSALFPLAGIAQKIEFGTALLYANEVSKATGVDPAFLLAILTQESNLGANVGQCYLTNPDTGSGVGKNTGTPFVNVMKPTRDVGPFLEITNALGLNAFQTAVSCPIAGVAGWGGAMGPAQFIPSTWELYQVKITALTGNNPPNPWTPRDAFAASGIYLSELGADARIWTAERTAALKYYAGSRWNLAKNAFYGNEVMKIAADYQELIDTLQNN